jgi:heme A synthase
MKGIKSNVLLTISGLLLGLLGTLGAVTVSSAFEATPSTYGAVTATWLGVSVAIVAGVISANPKDKEGS